MIVVIIILIIYFTLFKKSTIFYKYALICIIPGILLTNVLCHVPLEKPFNLFTSPEKAFSYSSIDSPEFIVESENTALVCYSERFDNSEYGFKFFQKQNDKWDIVYNQNLFCKYDTEVISPYTMHIPYKMHIFDIKKTSEKFIIIKNPFANGKEVNINISDTLQSDFEQFTLKNKYSDKADIFYYTVLKEMPENYEIMIDGKVVYPIEKS